MGAIYMFVGIASGVCGVFTSSPRMAVVWFILSLGCWVLARTDR